MKNTPVETIQKKEMVKEEEMNGQFRSFSVLEEETKDSNKTKSIKTISDQHLISTEKNEEKVSRKTACNFFKSIFRLNHHLYSIQLIFVDIVIKIFHHKISNYMKSIVNVLIHYLRYLLQHMKLP
jgi:hypothetical protein